MKTPNIYARAARRMERDESCCYPCGAIMKENNSSESFYEHEDCLRFMSVFTRKTDGEIMSRRFIKALYITDDNNFIDHSIIALCFAAAMLDAGDLP